MAKQRRYLCVWFPNWPIQRRVVAQPELRKQPLVLIEQDGRRGRWVSACSPRAWQCGIRPGMLLAEAQSLARHADRSSELSRTGSALSPKSATQRSSSSGPASASPTNAAPEASPALGWHWLPAQPREDRQALEALADYAQWFSPQVGLEQAETPAGLLLETTGLGPLFGGEESLARQLAAWLLQRGYWPRVVIADTLLMAWGVARYGMFAWSESLVENVVDDAEPSRESERSGAGSPLRQAAGWEISGATEVGPSVTADWEEAWLENVQRELGSIGLKKGAAGNATAADENASSPNAGSQAAKGRSGLVPRVIPQGDHSVWLQLPIEALRLPAETCDLLRQLGVERIHQVSGLPRDGLASRLGPELMQRWDQATGRAETVLVTFRPEPEVQVRLDLESPATTREALESWLEEALQRLVRQLQVRQQGVLRLDVILAGEAEPPRRWRLDLFRPCAQLRTLRSLLRLQNERQAVPKVLQRVELQAVLLAPLEVRQRELFETAGETQRSIDELINRLSCRLGTQRVLEARSRYGAQPEQSYRTEPWAGRAVQTSRSRAHRKRATGRKRSGSGASQNSASQPVVSWQKPLWRPLRLLPRPWPLEEVVVTSEGLPAEFRFQGQRWRVLQAWGPERIETGWWRGPWVRRDYYRLAVHTGQRWWVFWDRERNAWLMHGEF